MATLYTTYNIRHSPTSNVLIHFSDQQTQMYSKIQSYIEILVSTLSVVQRAPCSVGAGETVLQLPTNRSRD